MDIKEIIAEAERKIAEVNGFPVKVFYTVDVKEKKVNGLLKIVAKTLDMEVSDLKKVCRERRYVWLRHISTMVVQQYFPKTTLKEICVMYGQSNHTTILHSARSGHKLLKTDREFKSDYRLVQAHISKWLQNKK